MGVLLTYHHARRCRFDPHDAQHHPRKAGDGHDAAGHDGPVQVNTGPNDQQAVGHDGHGGP